MRTVRPTAVTRRPSQEALLNQSPTRHPYRDSIEMEDTAPAPAKVPEVTREHIDLALSSTNDTSDARHAASAVQSHQPLRLYKRRFFGLFQLVLLNVIVSWDVSCCNGLDTLSDMVLTISSGSPFPPLQKHQPPTLELQRRPSIGLARLFYSPLFSSVRTSSL